MHSPAISSQNHRFFQLIIFLTFQKNIGIRVNDFR